MRKELQKKLNKVLFLLIVFFSINTFGQNFRTVWRTTAPNETITIPTSGGGYNYTVDWGDGNSDVAQVGDAMHTYTVAGDYTVTISGTFPRIFFNNAGDKLKIRSVEEWGSSIAWDSMVNSFYGCTNLVNNATDVPDLTGVSAMIRTFYNCSNLGNGSATNWNSWDVSSVTSMFALFQGASSFNKNIGGWNVSNVSGMNFMFYNASSFNQNIGSWVVSKVTNMSNMFDGASAFNQNISSWNVEKVTTMYSMFRLSSFNQNIGNWNVEKVTDMNAMFFGVTSFNQDLSSWNVAAVTDMSNMFTDVTLSTANYDALLVGWDALTLQSNVTFHGGNSKYQSQAAVNARANMISSNSWSFTDGGRVTVDNTWTGTTNTDWNTATNWDVGIVPLDHHNVIIPNVANDPIISATTGAITNDITVNGDGLLTLENGSSLIIYGISSGDLTYNISVTDDKWHLISPPFRFDEYDNTWIADNSIDSGTGDNRGVATYDNTTDADGDWSYYQSGAVSENFLQAIGYSLKRTGAGNYSFTGEFPISNVFKTIAIGNAGTGNENRWNLMGNPYPSYIRVSELISANAANLTDTHEFVYVWDNAENSGAGGYKVLLGTDYIHPGQGFFVNADNSNPNNFTISESLQSHQTGITFYKNSNPSIKLFMNDGNNSKSTEIVYENNATTGLDKGFDAGTFTGTSTAFSIYSHLVSSSEGVDFMRQSLPKNNYENMVIPIGVNAYAEKEIIFSVNHQNLPNDLMVFIEDKENKTITRLDENNSSYKITLNSKNNGIGRFFLRTSTTDLRKTLDINDFNLDHISMYMANERTLRVTGLIKSDYCIVNIYNIVGKQVLSRNKRTNSILDITMPSSIKQGIYIVKIETSKGNLVKKIFLK